MGSPFRIVYFSDGSVAVNKMATKMVVQSHNKAFIVTNMAKMLRLCVGGCGQEGNNLILKPYSLVSFLAEDDRY